MAQEREVERWAVKDGMDDLGAREQFPSCLEVYTMYPPDTPGQPYVCSPDPELAELSTVLKLMGLSNMDEDWVSFRKLDGKLYWQFLICVRYVRFYDNDT